LKTAHAHRKIERERGIDFLIEMKRSRDEALAYRNIRFPMHTLHARRRISVANAFAHATDAIA
jgi:hypothetical protein